MNQFKKGDKVKCVRGTEGGSLHYEPLKTGGHYVVIRAFLVSKPSIEVQLENGEIYCYFEDRFIKE